MMWARNIQVYRLLDTEHLPLEKFAEALETYRFQPCSETQSRRVGWSAPAGSAGNGRLVHEVSGHRLISLMRQERILPAPVIRDELAERVDKLTAEQGFPPGRRDKVAMKEQIVEELLPRAFTKNSRTDVWIDTQANIIGVAAGSAKQAEEALDVLRESLGSLKVIPLAPQTPAGRTMTTWLTDPATRPEGVLLGDRVVLRAKGDDGKLAATDIDLDGDEVRTSLEVGRQVSQMALTFEEQMSFTLTEDMSIKGVRFADAVLKEVDDTDSDENPVMQMETEFVLAAQCLAHTIDKLMHALGGEADPMQAVEKRLDDPEDGMLPKVIESIRESGNEFANISYVQRTFKIGYNRAARLVEAMEDLGVVSKMDNQGRRRVIRK